MLAYILGPEHLEVTQVSREELQAAMGFLQDQLGEDELRALLERLNAWGDSDMKPIPVASLMQLAQSPQPADAPSK